MSKSYKDITETTKVTNEDLYRVIGGNMNKVDNKAIDNRNKSLGTITPLKDGLPDKSKMKGKKGKPATKSTKVTDLDDTERICKGILSRLGRAGLGNIGSRLAGRGVKAAERGIKAGGRAVQRLGRRTAGRSMARRGVIPTTGTRVGRALERAGRFAEKSPGAIGGAGVVGAAGGLGYLASRKKRKKQQEAEYEGCDTPGNKIRSKGRGRGLATGKGKGPIGRMANKFTSIEDIEKGISRVIARGLQRAGHALSREGMHRAFFGPGRKVMPAIGRGAFKVGNKLVRIKPKHVREAGKLAAVGAVGAGVGAGLKHLANRNRKKKYEARKSNKSTSIGDIIKICNSIIKKGTK